MLDKPPAHDQPAKVAVMQARSSSKSSGLVR
jgi:hypothetical protein